MNNKDTEITIAEKMLEDSERVYNAYKEKLDNLVPLVKKGTVVLEGSSLEQEYKMLESMEENIRIQRETLELLYKMKF